MMAGAATRQEARFVLEPLAYTVEAEALARWVREAAPGSELRYAWGQVEPRTAAAWAMVQELTAAGLVTPLQRRADGQREWIIRKRAPVAVRVAAGRPDPAAAMLAHLTDCASRGLPCPTNAALAVALNLRDGDAARYLIRRLIVEGAIRVRHIGPRAPRLVTIVASGKCTAEARA
ncbi:MAG: hypothetical protein CMN73_04240 [Sphingomonas sp.]|nr:hypothetical protein [Sphingomonas sp.]